MNHFFNPLTAADIISALPLFEKYDVMQLCRVQNPFYSHVLRTNTWCAKASVYDANAWEIDYEKAECLLNRAKRLPLFEIEDNLFPDDLLFEFAYNEFWSRFEEGVLYGVDYFDELVPYYNPNQPILHQFPIDSEFEYTDTGSKSIREMLAIRNKKIAAANRVKKVSKKTLVKWSD